MSATAQHNVVSALDWPLTQKPPPLTDGEVHVICVSLDVSADRLTQLKATLSADELGRAARFHFRDGKDRFVAGRGLLREVLAHYLGVPAEQVEFQYSSSGKPQLADPAASHGLHFNVAHSGGDAVFALTRAGTIGIDLERMRAIPDMLQMVSLALSEGEKREWDQLDAAEWRRAFFDCWARKEAFLKGIGEGLQRQPGEIEVSLRRSQPDEALYVLDRGCRVDGWLLRSLSAGDYAIALAIKGQPTRVSCWAWQPQEEIIPVV